MSPWIERRGDGPRTHALVVGTSYYSNLPATEEEPSPRDRETFGLRHAKTPATAAYNFARWLEAEYNNPDAPLGSVWLLLSPSQWERENVEGLDALPASVPPATRDNVATAVDDWHDACATDPGNVAVLYSSGHGIQMSKDDGGIVLLEDFATRSNNVLEHSLDVPAVRKGMAGATMAQHQFYFVDACQMRPEAARLYQTMGNGVGLQNPYEGAPRSSPVYFSAAPSTNALGEPGKGTLFGQALLECLEILAVDDHVHEEGRWVVTTGTLMSALPDRVKKLATSFGMQQDATTGGTIQEVVFHVLPTRPEVPIEIGIDPEEAASCALAMLWDGRAAANCVFERERFTPILSRKVPAGQYVLSVTIDPPTPPYADVPALPVPALPPAGFGPETIQVS